MDRFAPGLRVLLPATVLALSLVLSLAVSAPALEKTAVRVTEDMERDNLWRSASTATVAYYD